MERNPPNRNILNITKSPDGLWRANMNDRNLSVHAATPRLALEKLRRARNRQNVAEKKRK